MPSGQGAGTNPIHNKKPKKKAQDLDEDDIAHKAKLAAGWSHPVYYISLDTSTTSSHNMLRHEYYKKARDELAGKVGKGKGPLNTGSQGIKKSGKK
ncbi:hypothetical protein SNOG_07168 [Parastagonospora nodorum SN15]|uniref:Uncharacterized protein n=1 Tax=Phaeosphaeria nodorum (strain SN15 / ATCC MYA-4574 / FGSC 10173) TaxID=321614 RepID=Q0UM46_PHANO|nr:hypothetical protein SNOG_07168 [Parastagonospora nodorum SN15]EAT85819.1 hypothetical protein SNOG_07168 [Parastagonospora nodorum SN15]